MRRRAAVAVLAGALAVGGCAAGGPSRPAPTAPGSTAASPAPGAHQPLTRWWSDAAHAAGSTIDPSDPPAATAGLQTSRAGYCSMLRQTVRSGRSALAAASTAQTAAATRAFLAELSAVAPPSLAAPWRVVGSALDSLLAPGGARPRGTGIDAAAVGRAERAIALDAKRSCGVDLGRH
jgi:hypothetical protein